MSGTADSDALARLRRWEDSGATWRVLARGPGSVEIALLSCDAGEEMDRLHSTDPAVLRHVDDHDSPDDGTVTAGG